MQTKTFSAIDGVHSVDAEEVRKTEQSNIGKEWNGLKTCLEFLLGCWVLSVQSQAGVATERLPMGGWSIVGGGPVGAWRRRIPGLAPGNRLPLSAWL